MKTYEVLVDDTKYNGKPYKKGETFTAADSSYIQSLIKQQKIVEVK